MKTRRQTGGKRVRRPNREERKALRKLNLFNSQKPRIVAPELPEDISQPNRYVITRRENGRKGGLATAARYPSAEFRTARSSKGGNACVARYGPDFYRHIRLIGIKKHKLKLRHVPVLGILSPKESK